MIEKIVNFSLFQLGWFICILGASWNKPYLALCASVIILLTHLHLTNYKKNDLKLLVLSACIGFFFDGLLQYSGMILYNNPGWSFPLTPLWIVMLWLLFSITLNHSLAWLKNRIILSVLFGAVGGPLAYLAGESLGAITVTNPQTIIILAAGWAIITPMLIRQSEKTW